MYDKARCLNNIYALAKERGIKIGDLEESAGVSRGYLSRVAKPDYQVKYLMDNCEVYEGMLAGAKLYKDVLVPADKTQTLMLNRLEQGAAQVADGIEQKMWADGFYHQIGRAHV